MRTYLGVAVRAFWNWLGGGYSGRLGRCLRWVNWTAVLVSVPVAFVAVTSFTHYWYWARWESSPYDVSELSIVGGWVEYSEMTDWSGSPSVVGWGAEPEKATEIDKLRATLGRPSLLATHLDWPLHRDAQIVWTTAWWSYSLFHAVSHLWSLPTLCIIRAVTKK